jgi:hypothetical protein
MSIKYITGCIIVCIIKLGFMPEILFAQEFDCRYGVPECTDLNLIYNDPAEVKFEMHDFYDCRFNENRISGYSDFHGVFDADYDRVVSLLSSPVNMPLYSTHVLNVKVEKIEGPATTAYFDLGIVFLGYKVSFITRMKIIKEKLSSDETVFRARLLQSLDGNLFESYSSWYVKKLLLKGRPLVYIRYFNRQGIRHPFPGMSSVVRMFSPKEAKSMVSKLALLSVNK